MNCKTRSNLQNSLGLEVRTISKANSLDFERVLPLNNSPIFLPTFNLQQGGISWSILSNLACIAPDIFILSRVTIFDQPQPKNGGKEMKKLALVLVVLFGLASFAWGKPPVKQVEVVEVVNDPLNVNIQNQPVNVSVVTQSSEYEYTVLRIEKGFPWEAVQGFQEELNSKAIEGWELVNSNYVPMPGNTHTCFRVMRRPK
jgi:hypothetical protein